MCVLSQRGLGDDPHLYNLRTLNFEETQLVGVTHSERLQTKTKRFTRLSLSLLKLFITKFSIEKTPRTSSCEFLCIREKISSKNWLGTLPQRGSLWSFGYSVFRVEYGLITKSPGGPPWVTFQWARRRLGSLCKGPGVMHSVRGKKKIREALLLVLKKKK